MGAGWYYCEDCQDKFTARMGTVLERSHVPIHKWLMGNAGRWRRAKKASPRISFTARSA